MNSNSIINLPAPASSTEPVRIADLESYISQINGTSSGLLPAMPALDVNKVLKVASEGIVGLAGVTIDSSNNLKPTSNDGGQLGSTSLSWSDLFLASGGVINWNNGTLYLVQSGSSLSLLGNFKPVNNDGGQLGDTTHGWSDLFLASGGVINWNNGQTTITGAGSYTMISGPMYVGGSILPSAASDLGSGASQYGNLFLSSGSTINWNNGDVVLTHSTDTLTLSGGSLIASAGTTTLAPIKLQSGTNLTTPQVGAVEFDGSGLYFSPQASARGSIEVSHFCFLPADYTLTSTTSNQKLFNTTTNGAVTLQANTWYEVLVSLHITTMSATSGNGNFSLLGGGSGTLTNSSYFVTGVDTATPTTHVASSTAVSTTDSVPLALAAINTNVVSCIKGIVKTNAAGTFIPSIALTTAAAAVVKTGSFIKLTALGSGSVNSVGNWT